MTIFKQSLHLVLFFPLNFSFQKPFAPDYEVFFHLQWVRLRFTLILWLGGNGDHPQSTDIELINYLSEDNRYMRDNLINSIIDKVKVNAKNEVTV